MTNRREYTTEFKLEAIKLVKGTGQPSAKIARDLGISGDLLSRWVRKYNETMSGTDAFPGKGKLAPYDKERFDLKIELARVTRERHLKKSPGIFCQPKRVKYSFIKEHRNCYKIQELCRFLDVSACGYYKWVAKEKSNKELAREELLGDIQKIYQASQRRYRAPKIHAELKALGKNYNIKTVQNVMQENGIIAKLRRRFKTKKQPNNMVIAPNILDQNFTTEQPNKVWVTDITYIKTKEGWLYLAAIIDLYSRMVVGWSMSNTMTKQLIVDSLLMAVNKRNPHENLLLHSD